MATTGSSTANAAHPGGPGTVHFHWDNHAGGHCAPQYVMGDVLSQGWCGSILGNFLN